MRFTQIAVAAAASLTLILTACSGEEPTESPQPSLPAAPTAEVSPSAAGSATPAPSIKPSADLTGIEVGGGETPELKVPAPWAIEKTTVKVLKESESAQVVGEGATVQVNYVGVNGRDGQVFDSSFGRGAPATFSVDGVIPGFKKALVGQKIGSRVLVGIAAADAYPQGKDNIQPGDNLVFVLDILNADFAEPVGKAHSLPSNAPKVTVGSDGPRVDTSGLPAPTELGSYYLIEGTGKAIAATDTIVARYRSFTLDGKVFEDAWAQKQPGALNNLLQGWEQGLVGKPAGSRVVLVIPPALAFPDGRTSPTLAPGQPLIYVIDVLYSGTAQ